ncbi:MAG: glycosyl hydrolase family 8 [Myxococcales bacterium]
MLRFLALSALATLSACSGGSANPASNASAGAGTGADAGAGAGAGTGQTPPSGGNAGTTPGAAGSSVGLAGGGSANGGGSGNVATGGTAPEQPGARRPFPQHAYGKFCSYPLAADDAAVQVAYKAWKDTTVTADGAGGFLRVRKPDSGAIVGSTASEGIGYGMILAVYFGDQPLFDGLWRYEQLHLDDNGLMNWDVGPDGVVSSAGMGGATDGDVDMAWALVMADKQWGGQGTLAKPYLDIAKDLIGRIWSFEVDHKRGEMLMAGDKWGDVDVTNPSYFAPAYFRVFGQVTNKADDWNKVIDANYAILAKSLNATNGNATNGLAPAWCNSSGQPVEAFAGAPTYFQNDATRVPFRVGQDYCYFGEPRAKQYLGQISSFYNGVGVANIVDGYNLDGSPHPDRAVGGLQAASFVGPAGVAAMSDAGFRTLLDQAYAAVATQQLTAGTIYYQKSWTALSLLMLTGNLVNLTAE